MRLVGADDLQARSAYQPVVHHQGARWIAYVGHHGGKRINPLTGQVEDNGTSIVDVTDPKHPRYLHHIPGAEGEAEAGGAAMVRVCDGKTLPRGQREKTYLLRTLGNLAHEVWDVTDPAKPARLSRCSTGSRARTRTGGSATPASPTWSRTARPPGWRTNRMTKIYDLGDPAQPRFIRDFGLPGQEPGSTGIAPEGVHGPIALRNRVYFAYGTGAKGALQIVDREKLLAGNPQAADRFAPTPENLLYPQIGRLDMSPAWGGHTAFPILGDLGAPLGAGRAGPDARLRAAGSESLRNECQEVRQLVVHGGRHHRAHPVLGGDLRGAGSHRRLLPAGRALRPPLEQRVVLPDLLRPACVHRVLQRGGAGGGRPRSVPPDRGRLLYSVGHRRRRTSAASRSPARPAARPRSRPTTSTWTTAASSTWRTGPIPGSTSWS